MSRDNRIVHGVVVCGVVQSASVTNRIKIEKLLKIFFFFFTPTDSSGYGSVYVDRRRSVLGSNVFRAFILIPRQRRCKKRKAQEFLAGGIGGVVRGSVTLR